MTFSLQHKNALTGECSVSKDDAALWQVGPLLKQTRLGFYTILPLPILYGIYCNKGGSEGYNILRNSMGGER